MPTSVPTCRDWQQTLTSLMQRIPPGRLALMAAPAPPPPVTFADALQSLRMIRAYLEVGGCDDYGVLYGLTDHLHALNRKKKSTQKTIKDYFSLH